MKNCRKTVLWISRHPMTAAQLEDLRRVMGGSVALIPWKDTVEDLDCLFPALRRADAVAAVLPLSKMAALLKLVGDRPLLQARAGRVPTGRVLTRPDGQQEAEFAFVHQGWQRLLRVEVVSEPL